MFIHLRIFCLNMIVPLPGRCPGLYYAGPSGLIPKIRYRRMCCRCSGYGYPSGWGVMCQFRLHPFGESPFYNIAAIDILFMHLSP